MEVVPRASNNESRRTLLETLVGGQATAGELAALLPIARPGVSRHLRVLPEAGLVEVRQEAQRRVYGLRPEPLAEVDEWLGPYRALWERRLDALTHGSGSGKPRTKEHQMTSDERGSDRILGSLRSADGKGIVRMEDRFDTDIDDLWSALTDPGRLARWLWRGRGRPAPRGASSTRTCPQRQGDRTGRVDACEPPQRRPLTLRDQTLYPGQPDETVIEAQARRRRRPDHLGCEERGLPLPLLAAYGAGVQIHVENLAAHLAGREPDYTDTRWDELLPAYQALGHHVG